jgi:hypothetical protein
MAVSIETLISRWSPRLQKAFLDSVANLRNTAQVDQIVKMLQAGDVNGAIEAVGLNPVAFRPFDLALTNAFEAAGVSTGGVVPTAVAANGLKTVFQFNIRNPAAEAWLREYSSTLVTDILGDQRNMIQQTLTRGLERGLNPRTTALDLVGRIGKSGNREGGLIGLTNSQEAWVSNYADELGSSNPTQALTRTLRDARFDPSVIAAERNGVPLEQNAIDNMVTAYRNRALRYRAENIARTETMTSLHEAQQQSIEQAVADGVVDQTAVTFVWRTAEDDRVRDSHVFMDGQEVQMGQMFVTGDGNLLEYPGDPSGPPEEIINCRCFREPLIDFLASAL